VQPVEILEKPKVNEHLVFKGSKYDKYRTTATGKDKYRVFPA